MLKNKVTCISINWWGDDWAELLTKSILKTAKTEPIITIFDNHKTENLGHGLGLDTVIGMVKTEFIAVFDIDCHLLLDGWDEILIKRFNENKNLKLAMASDGGLLKPVRPLAMFFRTETFRNNKISCRAVDLAGVKFDVGVHAYFRTLSLFGDKSILQLPYKKTDYVDVMGTEYTLDGKRFVYHNWWGTRWFGKSGERVHDQIDGVKFSDFAEKKKNLFNQVKQ